MKRQVLRPMLDPMEGRIAPSSFFSDLLSGMGLTHHQSDNSTAQGGHGKHAHAHAPKLKSAVIQHHRQAIAARLAHRHPA